MGEKNQQMLWIAVSVLIFIIIWMMCSKKQENLEKSDRDHITHMYQTKMSPEELTMMYDRIMIIELADLIEELHNIEQFLEEEDKYCLKRIYDKHSKKLNNIVTKKVILKKK